MRRLILIIANALVIGLVSSCTIFDSIITDALTRDIKPYNNDPYSMRIGRSHVHSNNSREL